MHRILILTCLVLFIASSPLSAQKVATVDFAKKIAEATPDVLPQSPAEKRPSSDARDIGLRGKIKSVLEYTQDADSMKRIKSDEDYYDENGNQVMGVSFDDGYPVSVAVWGFLDGMRVMRSRDITYAPGEKPASDRMVITVRAEDNAKDPNAPRDRRYSMRKVHVYDAQARLTEESWYQNNGEIWTRNAYTYDGNRRMQRNYGNNGDEMSKTAYILDSAGHTIEEHMYDENDKVSDKSTMKYELDPQGNWIVQRTYEVRTVKKQKVQKLLWTSYRTITYYP
jgi:hypothetical protein